MAVSIFLGLANGFIKKELTKAMKYSIKNEVSICT